VDSHSDQQLLRGFFPFCRQRGHCEVRGRMTNLWYAAARALGFKIGTLCCPDALLVQQVLGLCPRVKSLAKLGSQLRCPSTLLDVVFLDLGSLPLGPDSITYWGAQRTPHLFFCNGSNEGTQAGLPGTQMDFLGGQGVPTPPPGWTVCLVSLAHRETGGSTSGRWTFVVRYPPGFPWVEPLVWEPCGGTPLLCCVNNREQASPFHGRCSSGVRGEGVVCDGGLVLDFGLFPALDLAAEILVESSGSPSGYGSRCLTARELGNLWDVPILFLDSLSDTEVSSLMEVIFTTPLSKLLHTGVDVLLTSITRGGCRGTEGVGDVKRGDLGIGLGPCAWSPPPFG
jgi:hypothetical protein